MFIYTPGPRQCPQIVTRSGAGPGGTSKVAIINKLVCVYQQVLSGNICPSWGPLIAGIVLLLTPSLRLANIFQMKSFCAWTEREIMLSGEWSILLTLYLVYQISKCRVVEYFVYWVEILVSPHFASPHTDLVMTSVSNHFNISIVEIYCHYHTILVPSSP